STRRRICSPNGCTPRRRWPPSRPSWRARRRGSGRFASPRRHCEERSDEANHISSYRAMDCFATLAMTEKSQPPIIDANAMKVLLRFTLALAAALAAPALAQTAVPVDLRILAINDFHGYLQPFAGGIRIDDPVDKTKKITVPAGGAEHMATLV